MKHLRFPVGVLTLATGCAPVAVSRPVEPPPFDDVGHLPHAVLAGRGGHGERPGVSRLPGLQLLDVDEARRSRGAPSRGRRV